MQTPSCEDPERGIATPPRRLIEVSRGISRRGGRTVNMSICQEDFSRAVGTILQEIGAAARPVCR